MNRVIAVPRKKHNINRPDDIALAGTATLLKEGGRSLTERELEEQMTPKWHRRPRRF